MQCPTCDYQLSPFDKKCPRCEHFQRKGVSPPVASQPKTDQETSVVTTAQEKLPLPEQAVQQIPVIRSGLTATDKVVRGLAIFLSLIVISILATVYYNNITQNGLTGRWVDKVGWNTFQFNSDGTATWDFHPPGMSAFYNLTYTADGSTLTETFREMDGQPITAQDKYFGHPLTRTYTLEGNELIIRNPDNGTDWTLSRE